jgi:hypothetical protein
MIEKQKNNIKFSPRTDLILPEYGRNIQQMVKHAVTIEDRNERTKCAYAIINVMGNMFPYLRDVDGFKFKLWDHLAVMSQFKLDIDYPFEVLKKENLVQKPNKLPYSRKKMRYMHYGTIVEKFIEKTETIKNPNEKNAFIMQIANYMKKSLLEWNNKDINIDDKKIFIDLHELSKGKISLNTTETQLNSSEFLRSKKRNNNQNNNTNRRYKKTKN